MKRPHTLQQKPFCQWERVQRNEAMAQMDLSRYRASEPDAAARDNTSKWADSVLNARAQLQHQQVR